MSTTPRRPGDAVQTATDLAFEWQTDPRWAGVRRDHTAEDVIALRGPVLEEHTLARRGAERPRPGHRPRTGVRPLRRPDLGRVRHPRPRARPPLRRGAPRGAPGPEAG